MFRTSFLNFQNGGSRKMSVKQQLSFRKPQRQISNVPSTGNYNGHSMDAEEIKWVFDKFDTNKDGKISQAEYKAALMLLGKGGDGSADMAKSFKAIDTDGDGFIDLKEFMAMMNSTGDGVSKKDLESAFRVFDLDGNGRICAEELMEVMKKIGERCSLNACQQMIRGVDSNGDGLIDIDEFITMMTRTVKLI